MKVKVINATDLNGTKTISDQLFVKKLNPTLIAQAVRVYLSNQRQGTSKTQARGDVNRTSKKWYKQKGTGNARHGDKTATLFVGGAVAHGPRGIENWKRSLSKAMARQALKNALTAQAKNIVLTDEILKSNGKTKEAYQFLKKIGLADKKVLLVLPKTLPLVLRSFRNIDNVLLTSSQRLNTYEVALADAIIFTTEAIKLLEQRLTAKKSKKASSKNVVVEDKSTAKKTDTKKTKKKVAKTKTKTVKSDKKKKAVKAKKKVSTKKDSTAKTKKKSTAKKTVKKSKKKTTKTKETKSNKKKSKK